LNLSTMKDNNIKYIVLLVYNFSGGNLHDLYTKVSEHSSDGGHISQFE